MPRDLSGVRCVAGDPGDLKLEEFTEAARQVRGLCDDLEMMREQAPA